jgi:hypothetical protein
MIRFYAQMVILSLISTLAIGGAPKVLLSGQGHQRSQSAPAKLLHQKFGEIQSLAPNTPSVVTNTPPSSPLTPQPATSK